MCCKMDQEISSNEKTPLLGTEQATLENHRTRDVPVYDTKPNGPSPLSRSFSTDSNQFGSTRGLSNTPKLSPMDEGHGQPDSPEVSSRET